MAGNNKKYVELLWHQKYDKLELGEKMPVERHNLPFQIVETVNKPRIKGGEQQFLYPEDAWPRDYPKDWKNLLIWGDNKLVMSSLIKQGWAGKINLIYIDPPFFTGADFTVRTKVGDEEIEKEPSIIEERAYKDTWSGGIASYLKYMYERLVLMRDLLAENGSIYVHLDWHVGHYVKVMMDEIFGYENFRNEIVWKRADAHNDPDRYGNIHDLILFYTKTSQSWTWNIEEEYQELPQSTVQSWYTNKEIAEKDIINRLGILIKKGTIRYFNKADITGAGANPNDKPFKGIMPPAGRHWAYKPEVMEKLDKEGRIYFSKSGKPYEKRYLDESKGIPPQSIWTDISLLRGMAKSQEGAEWLDFDTQKPEKLLKRIINISSSPGDIVADFFCGSGTTLAVAEKLGRRWVGCDLSKFAIQVTRKRLLDIHNSKDLMGEEK